MMVAESVDGALRRAFFGDTLLIVRQGGVVVGAALVFAIAWFAVPRLGVRSGRGALGVGLLWVVLTVGFETALAGAMGLPASRLLADYDVAHGGWMPLGLFAMALTPWIVWSIRRPGAA
jgi:hypothetical protein